MYAIEFQTRLKNGVIEIPHQFLGNLKGEVRVILLVDQASRTAEGFIDQLLAQPVRMKGFRPLTREEVHAR